MAERAGFRVVGLDLEGQQASDRLPLDEDRTGGPVDEDIDSGDPHPFVLQAGEDLLDGPAGREDILDHDGPGAVEAAEPGAEGHLFVDPLAEGEFLAELQGGQEPDGDGPVGRGDDIIEIQAGGPDTGDEEIDDPVEDSGLLDQADLLEVPLGMLSRGQLEMAPEQRVALLEKAHDFFGVIRGHRCLLPAEEQL